MLVYRIEHPETKMGPYQVTALLDVNEKLAQYAMRLGCKHGGSSHPSFFEDFTFEQIPDRHAFRFAFGCKERLLDWFDGCLDELDEHGYKLYIFDSRDVRYGKSAKQVMFRLEESELVATKSLKELGE